MLRVFTLFFFSTLSAFAAKSLDLSGEWKFALDANRLGIEQKWYESFDFNDVINLPSTTDISQKGQPNPLVLEGNASEKFDGWQLIGGAKDSAGDVVKSSTLGKSDAKNSTLKNKNAELQPSSITDLTRAYSYEGAAWYAKNFEIPAELDGKFFRLFLERTKITRVFLDGKEIGKKQFQVSSAHVSDLGILAKGNHRLAILVDNDLTQYPKDARSHMLTFPGSNWNGIIGRVELLVSDTIFIESVKIVPNAAEKFFDITVNIIDKFDKGSGRSDCELTIEASPLSESATKIIQRKKFEISAASQPQSLRFYMGDDAKLWSEFEPNLYNLNFTLKTDNCEDSFSIESGLRDFKRCGNRLYNNNKEVFLRGKHDALTFPLTGCPPMDLESWIKFFGVCKQYGINHIRYHTCCPPEAAFKAANRLGLYIAIDASIWGGYPEQIGERELYVLNDSIGALKSYSNNPSLVMFSMGNETWGSRKTRIAMRDMLKTFAEHLLYSIGMNYDLSEQIECDSDDFWVTYRTRQLNDDDELGDTRASYAYCNKPLGMLERGERGGATMGDFSASLKFSTLPVIGHETGQYLFYPDFDEPKLYTGVMKPWVFAAFEQKLRDSKLFGRWRDFYLAAGNLAVICYKREIELALATPDFSGFELLDLQDFPSQGWAIVGPLNPFMQPKKDIVSAQKWREFCSDIVPLAKFPKYSYAQSDVFEAEIDVACHCAEDMANACVVCELVDESGNSAKKIKFDNLNIARGNLRKIGDINFKLADLPAPARYQLVLTVENAGKVRAKNRFDIWVFENCDINKQVISSAKSSKKIEFVNGDFSRAIDMAESGASVLFTPNLKDIEAATLKPSFITNFWTWSMFKEVSLAYNKEVAPGTMGLLIHKKNRALDNFPTQFHSNWQWFDIIAQSRTMRTNLFKGNEDALIVEVIDNIWRRDLLSLIFEVRVGKGKMIVCSVDFNALENHPAGAQLQASIVRYMESEYFNPKVGVHKEELAEIFKTSK